MSLPTGSSPVTGPDWSPAPADIYPAPAAAHVIRMALNLPAGQLTALRALLSADEIARVERLRSPAGQMRMIAARGQARQMIAAALNHPPTALEFCANAYGKPALVTGDLCFNLSHSADIGLLALTRTQPVGVDVEHLRPDTDLENIARRFFAPAEAQALFALPPSQRIHAAYLAWTRKEAYIKARGLGLSIPLDEFVVALNPDQPAALLHADPAVPPWQVWSIYGLEPGPDYAGALAVEGTLEMIHCWDWNRN